MTVPWVFTVEELLAHFYDEGVEPSAEDIETAGVRVGRNSYPALVVDLYFEDLLTPEAAAVVVSSSWCACEFPSRMLDEASWRMLFDLAGYTVEGVPAARPSTSLRLWRGAIPECRAGWSWTDDRDKARWFAARPHNAGRGQVWTAEIEPGRLLARISEQRPGESEYVVDARGLTVTVADSLRTEGER